MECCFLRGVCRGFTEDCYQIWAILFQCRVVLSYFVDGDHSDMLIDVEDGKDRGGVGDLHVPGSWRFYFI